MHVEPAYVNSTSVKEMIFIYTLAIIRYPLMLFSQKRIETEPLL